MAGCGHRAIALMAWFKLKIDGLAIGFAGRHLGFG